MVDTTAEQARSTAQRVRKVVAKNPFGTQRGPIDITISIGLAQLLHDREGAAEKRAVTGLVNRADEALYEAKAAGKNQIASA